MAAFARSDDLRGAEFIGAGLRGAKFAEADLSGVVMRGVNADARAGGEWSFAQTLRHLVLATDMWLLRHTRYDLTPHRSTASRLASSK